MNSPSAQKGGIPSVPDWLATLDLGKYSDLFVQSGLTLEHLSSLSEADLEKFGVTSSEDRIKLLHAVEQLRHGAPPRSLLPGNLAHPKGKDFGPARKPPLLDRLGGRFLYISIAVHVIFALVAVVFVVQRIEAKRKLTFQAGQKGSPGAKAIEHKVQVTKKKNTMSAPAPSKRIAANTASARVSIPDMPMPMSSTIAPAGMLAGAGGVGPSFGAATMPGGGGGGGGGAIPFFGIRGTGISGLEGKIYDLKQTPGKRPSGMTVPGYLDFLVEFIQKDWPEAMLSKFYKGPHTLVAPQFCVPRIPAELAPKEFGVEKEVKPRMWVALYSGKVTPPETCTFHFVGSGDDVLCIKFNGKMVLNASWYLGLRKDLPGYPIASYQYPSGDSGKPWGARPGGIAKSMPIHVEAGRSYPIEILIGEQPGGSCHFLLLIEKEHGKYEKNQRGEPILPLFRFADVKIPEGDLPRIQAGGPIWKAEKAGTGPGSGLDFFKKPAQ